MVYACFSADAFLHLLHLLASKAQRYSEGELYHIKRSLQGINNDECMYHNKKASVGMYHVCDYPYHSYLSTFGTAIPTSSFSCSNRKDLNVNYT